MKRPNSKACFRTLTLSRQALSALTVASVLVSTPAVWANGNGMKANAGGPGFRAGDSCDSFCQQLERRAQELEREAQELNQRQNEIRAKIESESNEQRIAQLKAELEDNKKRTTANQQQKQENQQQLATARLKNASSSQIAQVYGEDIANTEKQIETGQVVTQLTTVGGQAVTGIQGQLATQKAAQEGTQTAAMKSGASLSNTSGMLNMAVGALNLWYASKHYQQMNEHETNENQLKQDFIENKASNTLNSRAAARASGKEQQLAQVNEAFAAKVLSEESMKNGGRADVNKVFAAADQRSAMTAQEALMEQQAAKSAAKQALAQNLIVGSVSMLNGAAAIAAGQQMKEAAKKVESINSKMPTYTPSAIGGIGDSLGGYNTTITGDGYSESNPANGDEANSDGTDTAGLGDPFGVQGPLAAPSNTPEVKMTAGGPGNPGGGGGGGLGGANTSPNTGAAEGEAQARMADNSRGAGYEGSGGAFRGGGGGGKGGAPDLSGLLAQFLPKKEDETNKNGIMDYRKRGLASDDSSLLDRNANLFERIHNAYQLKQRSRSVGI